jgi:hypothetical protein
MDVSSANLGDPSQKGGNGSQVAMLLARILKQLRFRILMFASLLSASTFLWENFRRCSVSYSSFCLFSLSFQSKCRSSGPRSSLGISLEKLPSLLFVLVIIYST